MVVGPKTMNHRSFTILISYNIQILMKVQLIQGVSKKKWDLGFRLVLRCSEVSDKKKDLKSDPPVKYVHLMTRIFQISVKNILMKVNGIQI